MKKHLQHLRQLPLFTTDRPLGVAEPPAPTLPYTIPVYRVELVRERSLDYDRFQFRASADVTRLLQAYIGRADREYFVVLMLDRKNRLIGLNTVAIGSLSAAVVHPRECFKPAILANAAAIILCHNHPSGDQTPSQDDRVLTRRMVDAGNLLGIDVLDHVVLGETGYYSFADNGALAP
jgi:DNA repair protein RadC